MPISIRALGLAIVTIGALGTTAAPAVTLSSKGNVNCVMPTGGKRLPAQILNKINAERRAKGLSMLKVDGRLAQAAQSHACDNAAQQAYSHYGSDGSDLKKRLMRVNFRPRIAVENTGLGFNGDSDRMMSFWMNSPKHRANILNPKVKRFGLGVAQTPDGRTTWVLNLGTPLYK